MITHNLSLSVVVVVVVESPVKQIYESQMEFYRLIDDHINLKSETEIQNPVWTCDTVT